MGECSACSVGGTYDGQLMKFRKRLRRRLIFMGILNAIFAPFIVLYLVMYSFFRYFDVRTPSRAPIQLSHKS